MTPAELNKELGNIDLYLLDLILKGKISTTSKILDAGCGEGRNLIYFINNGFDVYGVDINPMAIKMLQMIAKGMKNERFQVSSIEKMSFETNTFDFVICNAVLHFATGHSHFHQMMDKLTEVLKPHGNLFIRMTTNKGLSNEVNEKGDGIYLLPDGTDRYLLEEDKMEELLQRYNLKYLELPKSVLVANQRSMGVFVLQKQN